MSNLTAIIDADILIYAAASGAQTAIDWGDDATVEPVADEQEGINLLRQSIDDLMAKVFADDAIMCVSCASSDGWRKQVLPSYKENRAHIQPPILREFLKQYVLDNYTAFARPTLEGDDIYGILMTHPTLVKGNKIGCSMDKDMKTIPGEHYDLKHGKHFTITPAEAAYWHMLQTLTGDTTDGYKGCPGVGKVNAEDFLTNMAKMVPVHRELKRGPRKGTVITEYERADADSYWEIVLSLYHKAGLTEADALIQARVARICHASDYDFKTKQVILWNPPC